MKCRDGSTTKYIVIYISAGSRARGEKMKVHGRIGGCGSVEDVLPLRLAL